MDAEAVARVLASVPVFSALTDTERTELISHFARDAFHVMRSSFTATTQAGTST